MVATNAIPMDFLDLYFWQVWPRKYYTVKYFERNSEEKDTEHDVDGAGPTAAAAAAAAVADVVEDEDDTQISQSILANTVK